MNDDQFDRSYDFMRQHFDAIEQKIAEKADKSDVARLAYAMDNFIRCINDSRNGRSSREVSKKTGIPLPDL